LFKKKVRLSGLADELGSGMRNTYTYQSFILERGLHSVRAIIVSLHEAATANVGPHDDSFNSVRRALAGANFFKNEKKFSM